MDRPYIEKLRIQGYGCIKDAELKLTPLHALIGPNDSGKSTVLRALRTLSLFASGFGKNQQDQELYNRAADELRDAAASKEVTIAGFAGTLGWGVRQLKQDLTTVSFQSGLRSPHKVDDVTKPPRELSVAPLSRIELALRGAKLLRADPDEMRLASPIILEGQPTRFVNDRGRGLAAVYDALFASTPETYLAINKRVRELFPPVKGLMLRNLSGGIKAMGIKLLDETPVPAEQMSEGLLYFLAFAALPHLEPTSLLLIEEPENGLHPARIKEVMDILREISKTTQVVLATHSPLVINELQGDEVTILTRTPEEGTKARLLKDTFNYEERSKIYANGELWLSYSNGEDERDLFQAPEAAQ